MKVAVIGSRGIKSADIGSILPPETTEIVSGGAEGVDRLARTYALMNDIKYTEFLPEYGKYGVRAPLVRNDQIIAYSDFVVAIWDGKSRGTAYVLRKCEELGKGYLIAAGKQ